MKSYVFIAGGIGITPFRSVLVDLLHKKHALPITLFYCVSTEEEILFKDILFRAEKELGVTVIYIIKEKKQSLAPEFFIEKVPDYQAKQVYISGAQSFVLNYQEMMLQLGLAQEQIKIDSFTGYD